MKIQARAIEDTLRKPANYRAFLIYGSDQSIASDYLKTVVSVFTAKDSSVSVEKFRADKLKSEPYLLGEAVSSFSLLSATSLIVLEDATDTSAAVIKQAVLSPNCQNFLVVMAQELGPRSTLRALFEKEATLASIPCYEDSDQASLGYIRKLLREKQIRYEEDAVFLILSLTGNHRGMLHQNIEKLALYLEPGETLGMQAVKLLLSSQDEFSLDDFCFLVLDKNRAEMASSLQKLLAANTQSVSLLRSVSRYTERLISLKQLIAQGKSQQEAYKMMRPPVFYMHEKKYAEHLGRYSLPTLLGFLYSLSDQEKKLKRSASPALSISGFFAR